MRTLSIDKIDYWYWYTRSNNRSSENYFKITKKVSKLPNIIKNQNKKVMLMLSKMVSKPMSDVVFVFFIWKVYL